MIDGGADRRPAPLIVTALLPDDLQGWANRLRQTHFPPERNFLDAHVTLFHALPPSAEAELRTLFTTLTADCAKPAAVLDSIMSLGGGTAFRIISDDMRAIRDMIGSRFHGSLSAQDQQKPRLHVTVQNKVTGEAAKSLQRQLAETFERRRFAFAGLGLYAYRGGPWEALGKWPFRGKIAALKK